MAERFGPYELLELLGRGAMGEVYRARDNRRQRDVALKVLPPHLASDEQFAARFRRESLLAAQLNDPHIVPIHDFGEIDGRLFIDMRFVDGIDLGTLIAQRGSLPPAIAVAVISQIADALDAAHGRGLIHRDVKPSNVMLTGITSDLQRVPFAYLVDFGIARGGTGMTSLTGARATIGTIAYMSPETIKGVSVDRRADVYSLACSLFEALTGTIPFDGDQVAMMFAHVDRAPPRPSERSSEVPAALDHVIAAGMAKEPDDRPSTAGEFAALAERAVREPVAGARRDIPAPPVAPHPTDPLLTTPLRRGLLWIETSTPTPRVPRRRRAALALSAVVLVAGAAAAAVALVRSGQSHAAATKSDPTVVVATDLPLQGVNSATSRSSVQLIDLYLSRLHNRVGKYHVVQRSYDNSSSASGNWTAQLCAKNAAEHVAARDEVAVVGPFNSGCARIETPVLNKARMLLVSGNNTYVGLTKPWDTGEPGIYYPTGHRNYARVMATDDSQGRVAAIYSAGRLRVRRCLVLNDGTVYGKGVAAAFVAQARDDGVTVVAEQSWSGSAKTYTALFAGARSAHPDCVFLGGRVQSNGVQLVHDKVAVLGANSTVRLLAPDAFTSNSTLDATPDAAGMYFTVAGIADQLDLPMTPATRALLAAYHAKYGTDPVGVYPFYALSATQVALAALAASDGTRASVTNDVLGGVGVTIPAAVAAIGVQIHVDPSTGDITRQDVSLLTLSDGNETYVTYLTLN